MIDTLQLDPALIRLSEEAGLVPRWRDVRGEWHDVDASVLRSMLKLLGLACASAEQIAGSLRQLESEKQPATGMMLTVTVNEALVFDYTGSPVYTLTLEDGKQFIARAAQAGQGKVRLPGIERPGYHRLSIGDLELTIAVAPKRCPLPPGVGTGKSNGLWGVAAQVYSLRPSSPQTDGVVDDANHQPSTPIWPGWERGGDFGLLAGLARGAAQSGASALAISPVHAMFGADPQRYSPYAPSSRLFLNTAYIQPSIVLGNDAVRRALQTMGETISPRAVNGNVVEWPDILPRRMALLRRLFDDFRQDGPADLVQAFETFRRQGGEALQIHACYEALHAHHLAQLGPASGWQDWSPGLHDPRGMEVMAYAMQHEEEVGFHAFLQWLAERGLHYVQQSAREAGMSVGLIVDLAIGTDARGSHAWSRQGEMLEGVSVGAPPDLFQADGQNWGLTAFSPRALRQTAYAAFIETVRAVLAHAGGLRIDHILGMRRMWLVPPGAGAADGVYLDYPMQDMLRLLVLEAWRHKALVVGENLGTVPEGFNDQLERKGILGTSVLWFERSPVKPRQPDAQAGQELEGKADSAEPADADSAEVPAFLPPAQWPAWSMATPTTHDLPTIHGWWSGRDLEWRASGEPDPQETVARRRDKNALWQALKDAGCISASAPFPVDVPRNAVLSYVSKTPSPLVIVSLEDLLGMREQPNLPGGGGEGASPHPNWIQCLPAGVDEIFNNVQVASGITAIRRARRQT